MTISPATWERVEAIMERRAERMVTEIIEARAKEMIAGRLPRSFCPEAAAVARSMEKAA